MAYFETGGLNFWEILGLAILFIWAVNRYFRKRNEADDVANEPYYEKAPDRFAPYRPMDYGSTNKFSSLSNEIEIPNFREFIIKRIDRL